MQLGKLRVLGGRSSFKGMVGVEVTLRRAK